MSVLVDHQNADGVVVRCEMDEADLIGPFEGGYDNDNETAHWYEGYICRCHGEVVKKSLHLILKKGLEPMLIEAGILGG